MTPVQFTTMLGESYRAFAGRETQAGSACLCLMLDNWRRIRDQYGYSGLFGLLDSVSELVLSTLDGDASACALNERTILVFIPETSLAAAERQVAAVAKTLGAQAFSVGRESMALSLSIGYCEFDHRFTSVERLLIELVDGTRDTMLAGGNAIRKISPDISSAEASTNERQMLGLLMEALRKQSLKVYFQPLLATAGEVARSFQVLPRLVAADDSVIPAARFVPLARKAKVLGVLDRWMLQRTVQLLTSEYQMQPVCLFLSQGDSLLVQGERREWFRRLVMNHPDVSGRLVLDFALDDVLANLQGIEELARLAHDAGVKICFSRVDERSKWDLLGERLHADFIKMSPEFVQRLATDPGLEPVFQRISAPLRANGIKIIMPMVEDASVAANLWRTGADYMQGYMIERESETLVLADY